MLLLFCHAYSLITDGQCEKPGVNHSHIVWGLEVKPGENGEEGGATKGPGIGQAMPVALPTGEAWNPPEGLADFLAAGEPPVYGGFGAALEQIAGATVPGDMVYKLRVQWLMLRGLAC